MENKSKVFTKKLVALFLAVVMAVTCFSGVLAASAKSTDGYHDADIADEYNYLAWTEPLSNQTAEALLDLADRFIADLDVDLNMQMSGSYVVINFDINIAWPHVYVKLNNDVIDGYLDSIDGAVDLLIQVEDFLQNGDLINGALGGTVRGLLGDVIEIRDPLAALVTESSTSSTFRMASGSTAGTYTTSSGVVSQCGKSWRANMDAKDILVGLVNFVHVLLTDADTGVKLLNGTFDLGELIQNMLLKRKSLYDLLKDLVGAWGGWQNDLAYNAVAALLFSKTEWFSESEIAAYTNDGAPTNGLLTGFEYDSVLMDKLSTELLQKINAEITYPELVEYTEEFPHGMDQDGNPITGYFKDSSARRRYYIDDKMNNEGMTYEEACEDLGYDANLVYSEENTGNILLFQYGDMTPLSVAKTDNLYAVAWRALKLAWKTALAPTLGLLQVNYNGHDSDTTEGSVGTNYDNAFYSWKAENYGWDTSDVAANYVDGSTDYVEEWCAAVAADYGLSDAAAMKAAVKLTFEYDRSAVDAADAKYNWRDIEVTSLFNQVRYSPMADLYFGIQTGPLNLYLTQTGYPNIKAFLDEYLYDGTYTGIVEGIYDFLMAAVADLFPASDNIGFANENGTYTDANGVKITPLTVPTFTKLGNVSNTSTIASTFISSVFRMVEYTANATNLNILNPFYHNNGYTVADGNHYLNESNFEEAAVPLGIAALKQWNLTATIHDSEWDKATDIEGLAAIALNEYLGYLFPERDYSSLWTESNGKITATLEGTIVPMARDAIGWVLTAAGCPVYKISGTREAWDPYTDSAVAFKNAAGTTIAAETSTTAWDLLNGIVCYYVGDQTFGGSGAVSSPAKGFGAVAGLINSTNGQVSTSNTLWRNVDIIANRLLPALGTLQNNTAKSFNSYDLIYTKILVGISDMDENGGGLTNFIKQLLDILTCSAIKSRGVVKLVYYDIAAPLINAIANTTLISLTENNAPFDTLLKKATIVPLVGNLIGALVSRFKTGNTGAASVWNAVSFVINALNLVPELRVHSIGGVSAEFPNLMSTTAVDTTLEISNDSFGLNRFYIDGSGNYKEAGRYYANIKSVTVENESGNAVSNFTISNATGVIAPEKKKTATVTGTAPANNTVYTFKVTYDILAKDAITNNNAPSTSEVVQSDMQTFAYLYVTSATASASSWDSDVYSTGFGGVRPFRENRDAKENYLVTDPNHDAYDAELPTGTVAAPVNSSNDWTRSTAATSTGMYATFPLRYIIEAGNPSGSSNLGYRITNSGSTSRVAVNSIYAYPAAGYEYYVIDGGNEIPDYKDTAGNNDNDRVFVAVNSNGDLIGMEGNVVKKLSEALEESLLMGINYRTEVDEETQEESDPIYEVALVAPADAAALNLRPATSIPGVYLEQRSGEEVEKDEDDSTLSFTEFSLFSGSSSSTEPGEYSFNLLIRVGNATINVKNIIVDAIGNYGALTSAITDYTNILASYPSSYISNYQTIKAAVIDAVKATADDKVTFANYSTFLTLDDKRKVIEDAYKAAEIDEADNIATQIRTRVTAPRDQLSNVDYNVITFEDMVDMSQAAEAYLIAEDEDIIYTDEVDETGNKIPAYDDYGRVQYSYYNTTTSKVLVMEKIRLAEQYFGYLKSRGYIADKIAAEVTHATSLADQYDNTIAATANEASDFTAEADTSREAYRYAYSTEPENVKDDVDPYKIQVGSGVTDVKFGAIENGYLVNKDAEGKKAYTDKSWNAYVDAIGECLAVMAAEGKISETYAAKSHLVVAENNLEEAPVTPDGIEISGTVVIATNVTGTAGNTGVAGISVSADGVEAVETAADGSFTIIVPEGTTALTVDGETAIPRTVAISGTAAVADAVIPVVVCDYNHDGSIDGVDKASFNSYYNKTYSNAAYYSDFNHDGAVDGVDKAGFNTFYNKTVSYSALALD